MNSIISIFKREFQSYFATPLAYVFLTIFLILSSYQTFANGFFESRQASLRIFFSNMPILFILLVPAIAMRLWSEERKSKSIELLFTLPITTTQAVLGKFFAAWLMLFVALFLTFPIVISVAYLGTPDYGPIITGYVGSVLLAGSYLSISLFFSALTKNQVISFILSVVACGCFLYAGSPSILESLQNKLPINIIEIIESLSFISRFESIQRGVLQLRDISFFLVLGAGWLWATVVILEERKAE